MKKTFKKNLLCLLVALLIGFTQFSTIFTQKVEAADKSVKVKVRIEASDHTIVPETEVDVTNFELEPYNCNEVSGEPKAIHAIIKALEANGLNPKDQSKFNFGRGSYISDIDGVSQGSFGSFDGWGYYVNDNYTDKLVGGHDLVDGDSIVLFHMENYVYARYGYFNKKAVNAKTGEDISLDLTGKYFFPGGIPNDVALVDKAKIIINDKETQYITDENGQVKLNFDKPGTYIVTADKRVKDCDPFDYSKTGRPFKDKVLDNRMLARPYCKIVVEQKDKVAPQITTNISKTTVTKSEFTFIVSAIDDVDGKVNSEVKLGENVIEPNEDGQYVVNLSKGENRISVKAVDKAGNEGKKTIVVNYKELSSIDSYDVKSELEKTKNYMIANNGDEWAALSLSKFGIKGNKESFNNIVKQFKSGVEEDGLSEYFYKDTDLEKMIMYVTSQGYNPYNFLGHDLVKELFNRDVKEFNRYAQIFGLMVYDYCNVSGEYKITKDILAKELANSKVVYDVDGDEYCGWNIWGSDVDVDTTAAAINALSSYYDNNKEIKDTIDKAVKTLALMQKENGCYEAWGSEASESISFTILGLTSIGVDPAGELFTKSNGEDLNNLVSALLTFKGTDGQFKHTTDTNNNYMSSEQALRALIALEQFRGNGKYNYYKSNIDAKLLPVYVEGNNTPVVNVPEDTDDIKIPIGIIKSPESNEVVVNWNDTSLNIPSKIFDSYTGILEDYQVILKREVLDKNSNILNIENGTKIIGKVFDYTMSVKDNKGKITEIKDFGSNKVKVVIKLSKDDIKGIDVSKLAAYYYNGTKWEKIDGGKFDNNNLTFTFETTHFSIYSLMVKDDESKDNSDKTDEESNNKTDNEINNDTNNDTNNKTNNDTNNKTNNGGKSESNTVNGNKADDLPKTGKPMNLNLLVVGSLICIVSGIVLIKRKRISNN